VTSIYDGSSTSAVLSGLMWVSTYQEAPQAEYTGIALEFGTLPLREVTDALRADQWLENHPKRRRSSAGPSSAAARCLLYRYRGVEIPHRRPGHGSRAAGSGGLGR